MSCPRTQHNVPSQCLSPDRLLLEQAHWPLGYCTSHCLTTITQYNSSNSLTSEFKLDSSKKDIIWVNWTQKPTDQSWRKIYNPNLVLIRNQDPSVKRQEFGICVKTHRWSTIHSVFKILKSAQFTHKLHIQGLFKATSINPKTYSPPSIKERFYSKHLPSLLKADDNERTSRKELLYQKITRLWKGKLLEVLGSSPYFCMLLALQISCGIFFSFLSGQEQQTKQKRDYL